MVQSWNGFLLSYMLPGSTVILADPCVCCCASLLCAFGHMVLGRGDAASKQFVQHAYSEGFLARPWRYYGCVLPSSEPIFSNISSRLLREIT